MTCLYCDDTGVRPGTLGACPHCNPPPCGAVSNLHLDYGPCRRPAGHIKAGVLHGDATGRAWGYIELGEQPLDRHRGPGQ